METKTTTSNIPETGFTAIETKSNQERRLVKFNNSANFTFSDFSLLQFLHGRLLLDRSYGMSVDTKLVAKLGIYGLDSKATPNESSIELDRSEVRSLRTWLEARMKHCEEEREEYNNSYMAFVDNVNADEEPISKFNPDTYIAMKFLLLDIREWLAGDIID